MTDSEDVTARDRVYAGIRRVRAVKDEFTAADVQAHAPGNPARGTVYAVLRAAKTLGVVECDESGQTSYWRVVEDPEIPASERIIE